MPGQKWESFAQQESEWNAEFLASDHLIPGGTQAEISQFGFADAQTITVTPQTYTAGNAVQIQLTEGLKYEIPKGQVFDFGGGKLFTLTEKASTGSSNITGNLAVNLAGGETYSYAGITGRTIVPDGTLVGRTYAERDAGTGYGPADLAGDDEIFIVAFANGNMERDQGITLVRHRHQIYENKLPGWANLNAAGQAKVRELYDCLILPENV